MILILLLIMRYYYYHIYYYCLSLTFSKYVETDKTVWISLTWNIFVIIIFAWTFKIIPNVYHGFFCRFKNLTNLWKIYYLSFAQHLHLTVFFNLLFGFCFSYRKQCYTLWPITILWIHFVLTRMVLFTTEYRVATRLHRNNFS